jgi:peptidase E
VSTERHIVAMGGGGFSFGRDWESLDDFVMGLTGVAKPKIAFLPTASGDSDEYVVRYYNAFIPKACSPSHLALFTRTVVDLREYILDQDLVYVGGGNTANMLAVWRLHGLDVILREAWAAGVVMCGMSAGSLCWFEGGTTDSFGLDLSALRDGLGFIAGSFSPHYDGEAKRRPAYHRFIADGELANGMAADNGVGVHFVGTEFVEAVSVREGLHAYRVELVNGEVMETPIEPRVLPRA